METEFSQILKEFLVENNMSQSAFANKIGVKPSQISEWLRGKAKPGYDTLKQMSTALGVPADYFLGISETY